MRERLGKLVTVGSRGRQIAGVGSLHISTSSYSIHIVRLYLILLMSIMVCSCYARQLSNVFQRQKQNPEYTPQFLSSVETLCISFNPNKYKEELRYLE